MLVAYLLKAAMPLHEREWQAEVRARRLMLAMARVLRCDDIVLQDPLMIPVLLGSSSRLWRENFVLNEKGFSAEGTHQSY